MDFLALAQQCAPGVHPTTLQAVVRTESGFNPYAIGVVGGRLARQPRNEAEAIATAIALERTGWNYSVGLGQINRSNLPRYGLDLPTAFDPCANLRVGAAILTDCYTRARSRMPSSQNAVHAALSCYYSGNFQRGFLADANGTSYVQRVAGNAAGALAFGPESIAIPVVRDRRTAAEAVPIKQDKEGRTLVPSRRPSSESDLKQRSWDAFGVFQRQNSQ